MKVNGKHYRTIWEEDGLVKIIDQRWLPHKFRIEELKLVEDVETAIKDMHVRGAGLIGATAAWGMYVAAMNAPKDRSFMSYLRIAEEKLLSTRPTAKNLEWAINRVFDDLYDNKYGHSIIGVKHIKLTAEAIANEDADYCKRIGEHGIKIIEEKHRLKKINERDETVNIMTHCNAGWLAFVDYGSATAPIYAAHEKGIPVHVWVSETRPRNQGARLTAWELEQQGVPYTIIPDNVSGHILQKGKLVDMVMVGTDRTTHTGYVCNKIGTYMKALAAHESMIPFYVCLPSSTIDWEIEDGFQIPIEKRGDEEVKYVQGLVDGEIKKVLITPENSPVANYAFDVTPPKFITRLITERGIMRADKESIYELYPEKRK